MDAQSLFRIARDNWLSVLIFTLLGLSAGLLLASIKTPEYTAEAEVFVTVTNGGSTNELAQGSNYSQQQARNFSAVATREIVLGPVIEEMQLDTTVADLRKQVSASVPLNTSLISIEATDSDPVQAAAISNAVAKSLAVAANSLAPQIEDLKGAPVRLQLVETAEPPESPSVPNVPLWLFLGAAAGLAFGIAWVAIRELAVSRIRTKEQIDSSVKLSHLGSVTLDRDTRRHPVAIVNDPFSTRAEEYRQLRSSLRYLLPGTAHKTFVISSSVPGEGKSTTAVNLAATIAASGQSVCLVEADLRRPSLGTILDLDSSIGLSTILAGEADLDEVTQEWGEDGLQVVLAGGLPPNPSELLESERAEEVFARIRDKYSVVIVDTPPINVVADATALSRMLGGVVVVVGSKQVQLRELRRSVDKLNAMEVAIHGYVLNGAVGSRRNRTYYRHSGPLAGSEPEAESADTATDEADSDSANDSSVTMGAGIAEEITTHVAADESPSDSADPAETETPTAEAPGDDAVAGITGLRPPAEDLALQPTPVRSRGGGGSGRPKRR